MHYSYWIRIRSCETDFPAIYVSPRLQLYMPQNMQSFMTRFPSAHRHVFSIEVEAELHLHTATTTPCHHPMYWNVDNRHCPPHV